MFGRMTRLLAVAAVALCLAAPGWAERGEGGGRGERGPEARERMQEMRLKMIQRRLKLDTATAEQVSAVLKAEAENRQATMKKLQEGLQELEDLVKSSAADAQINTQLDALETLRAEQQAGEQKTRSELRRILGPTKSAQLLLMQRQMMQGMRERLQQNMRGMMGQGGRGQGNRRGGGQGQGAWGYE